MGYLPRHGAIPSVQSGHFVEGWAHSGVDVVRRAAEGQYAIRRNRRKWIRRRSLRQSEGAPESVVVSSYQAVIHSVIVRKYLLVSQDGQVLSYSMTEVGTEHTHIETTTVSHAYHSLRCDLIGKADARSERLPTVVNVTVQTVFPIACNAYNAFHRIRKAAVPFGVDALGEVNLPT